MRNLIKKRAMGVMMAVAAGTSAFVPSAGGRQPLQALSLLREGQWELRFRSGGVQRLCLGNPDQLIQLRHPAAPCQRIVLEDAANSITVQYTCRGKGYGRTHIWVEADRLFQLETQGISDGLPFEHSVEGRRVGACTS